MTTPLQLDRPLVVVDTETTGPYPKVDRVVQVALVKLYPDGRRTQWQTLVDPGRPIPPEATLIHGITDAMVRSAPPFASKQVAGVLKKGTEGCYLSGYNFAKFDKRVLLEEYRRMNVSLEGILTGEVVDVMLLHKRLQPRKLGDAYRDWCGKEHTSAHDALGDCLATLDVLEAMVRRCGEELPATPLELSEYGRDPDPKWLDPEGKLIWRSGEVCLNFGDQGGTPLRDLSTSYKRWMLRKEFSAMVKAIVTDSMRGIYPVEPKA